MCRLYTIYNVSAAPAGNNAAPQLWAVYGKKEPTVGQIGVYNLTLSPMESNLQHALMNCWLLGGVVAIPNPKV